MAELDPFYAAYEGGRRQLGTRWAPLGLLAGLLLIPVGADPLVAVLLGATLAVLVGVAGWARNTALSGALLGLGAVAVPLVANAFMSTWGGHCSSLMCAQVCASISVAGGCGIGFAGGLGAARSPDAASYLLGTLVTAGVAGLAGCSAVGLGNALGLGLGLTLAMLPGYAIGSRLAGAR